MPTRVKNKVDQNGVIQRQVMKQGQPGSTRGADKKRKPCCCYESGHFRVLLSARSVSTCPATRMLRYLREKSEAVLRCLASTRGKQLKVSSSTPTPSKQPAAAFDSHRNQAVEDCISYINSSTAPSSTTTSSSSSSSSIVTATLPPLKSTLPQIPRKSIATEPAATAPPPPPPPHVSSIPIPQCKSSSNEHTIGKSTGSPCP